MNITSARGRVNFERNELVFRRGIGSLFAAIYSELCYQGKLDFDRCSPLGILLTFRHFIFRFACCYCERFYWRIIIVMEAGSIRGFVIATLLDSLFLRSICSFVQY